MRARRAAILTARRSAAAVRLSEKPGSDASRGSSPEGLMDGKHRLRCRRRRLGCRCELVGRGRAGRGGRRGHRDPGPVTVSHSGAAGDAVDTLLLGAGDTLQLAAGSLAIGAALTNSGTLDIGANLVAGGGIANAAGASVVFERRGTEPLRDHRQQWRQASRAAAPNSSSAPRAARRSAPAATRWWSRAAAPP